MIEESTRKFKIQLSGAFFVLLLITIVNYYAEFLLLPA